MIDGFLKSWISKVGYKVYIECEIENSWLLEFNTIDKSMVVDGKYWYIFDVPEYFKADVDKFKQSKYSEMSDDAKNIMRIINQWKTSGKDTSALWLKLNKDERIYNYIRNKINDETFVFEGEWINSITEKEYGIY